jgi:hypothetical protein
LRNDQAKPERVLVPASEILVTVVVHLLLPETHKE